MTKQAWPIPWMGLVVASVVAIPWLNPYASGPYPQAWQSLLTAGSLATVLLIWCAKPQSVSASGSLFFWGLLLAAAISSVFACIQYFGGAAKAGGLINITALGDAFANLRQRNQFATLTAMGLAVVLWRQRTGPEEKVPLWTFLGAGLLALGNALSSSRTGCVQIFALGVLASIWYGSERKLGRPATARQVAVLWLVSFATYAIAVWALPRLAGLDPQTHGLLARMGGQGAACNSRVALWENVVELIAQRPWMGWGWGELGYAHYITPFPGLRFCEILDNAHNLPLQLAVEMGIPMSVLVCVAIGVVVWAGRAWHEVDSIRRVAWAVGTMLILHSMLEYPLWYGPFLVAAVVSLMVVWPAAKGRDDHNPSLPIGMFPRSICGGAALALLALLAYVGWDYTRVSQLYLPPEQRMVGYQSDTLGKVRDSVLFRRYVQYAELSMVEVTPQNAALVHDLSLNMLHFSAEPRVIEKLLESAAYLNLNEEILLHMQRYKAAFPAEFNRWQRRSPSKTDSDS